MTLDTVLKIKKISLNSNNQKKKNLSLVEKIRPISQPIYAAVAKNLGNIATDFRTNALPFSIQ